VISTKEWEPGRDALVVTIKPAALYLAYTSTFSELRESATPGPDELAVHRIADRVRRLPIAERRAAMLAIEHFTHGQPKRSRVHFEREYCRPRARE
jgi:hypothetical protein